MKDEEKKYAVQIELSGPDGLICREVFLGTSPEDLAMFGAAKGWLEGRYKESEPIALSKGMVGPMKEFYEALSKPREYPVPVSVVATALNPEASEGAQEDSGSSR